MNRRLLLVLPLLSLLVVPLTAAPLFYVAYMDGPSEFPPNASPGLGRADVVIDIVAHTLEVRASFSGLVGSTTAAHIHGPTPVPLDLTATAGVITQTPSFNTFPLGVSAGIMPPTVYDLTQASSYRPAFLSGFGGNTLAAEAALAAALDEGRAYFNVHSSAFPGGEIRGFLVPIPEPSTWALLGLGLGGLLLRKRFLK